VSSLLGPTRTDGGCRAPTLADAGAGRVAGAAACAQVLRPNDRRADGPRTRSRVLPALLDGAEGAGSAPSRRVQRRGRYRAFLSLRSARGRDTPRLPRPAVPRRDRECPPTTIRLRGRRPDARRLPPPQTSSPRSPFPSRAPPDPDPRESLPDGDGHHAGRHPPLLRRRGPRNAQPAAVRTGGRRARTSGTTRAMPRTITTTGATRTRRSARPDAPWRSANRAGTRSGSRAPSPGPPPATIRGRVPVLAAPVLAAPVLAAPVLLSAPECGG
jgi:hypothetical protein